MGYGIPEDLRSSAEAAAAMIREPAMPTVKHCRTVLTTHDSHAWKSQKGTEVWCPGTDLKAFDSRQRPVSQSEPFLPTDLYRILYTLLPEIGDKMRANAKEYGPDNHRVLGERGQFADIWRKIGKLKRAMWDGVETTEWREQPREILMDLIGHCLLTIAMMDRGDDESQAPQAE